MKSYKLIIIGDPYVGKTSVMQQFADGVFTGEYGVTVGIDFVTKEMDINGQIVRAQIWDTAGGERHQAITRGFYRDSHGVLLLYDVTNRESFLGVQKWLDDVQRFCGPSRECMLIGNKIDLVSKRKVKENEGIQYAKTNGMHFLETSAKSGENVQKAFKTVVEKIIQQRGGHEEDTTERGIQLENEQPTSNRKCC